MPNHVHALLYFPQMPTSLNTIIGNGKRFMAYEIIKRLMAVNDEAMLTQLAEVVKDRERKKGQLHKVFEDSFDAKQCVSTDFIYQKLDYIHHNPISGKWMLAADSLQYEHSSEAFYKDGKSGYSKLLRIEEVM